MAPPDGMARTRGDRAAYAQLLEHAGRTTVGLCAAPGTKQPRTWGSGVLIAPGWVLTCAHVPAPHDGRRREIGPDGVLGIVLGGRVVAARLEYDLSRPAPEAGPAAARADLALIRLLDPAVEQPCAWISDQSASLLEDAYIFRGHDEPSSLPGGARERVLRDSGGYDGAGGDGGYGHGGGSGGSDAAAPGPAAPVDPVDAFIAVRFGARDARGLQFGTDVRVTPGASGGPLVECDRGEVVGIVKGAHREDHLGLAVPVTALRGLGPEHLVAGATGLGPDPYHALMSAHDRWHWSGQDLGRDGGPTWFDAQHAIMAGRGRLWGVQERLQALDLLARLPAPRDPLVVEEAVADALDRGCPYNGSGVWTLRTWRDGHGALYQGSDPYAELRTFVHYLRIAAQRTADQARGLPGDEAAVVTEEAARLGEFVQAKAVVLRPQDRRRIGPVRRPPRSVLVEFEPLFFYDEAGPELFNWSVSEGYGRGQWLRVDVRESDGGVPFEQARDEVLRRLGARLLHADDEAGPGGRVPLEVAVPEGRWHTPVGQWEVAASTRRTARGRPVGPRRPVVLRDQARRDEVDPAWLRRWQGIAAARELRALRLPPDRPPGGGWGSPSYERSREPGGGAEGWGNGPDSEEALLRFLEGADDGALPALCHSVADGFGRTAVGIALDSGFPAGLWAAAGHAARECDAACEEFHLGVRKLLQGAGGVARLPELVRELRAEAAGPTENGTHWARDLVLLYDDPQNPLPKLSADRPQVSPPSMS
ncbi:trypsin-like peptidase domain-containing protein [Streptomyces sp. NPDC101150]|uniref:VMAP-C domain-containing protein n=1 Tax=Streptomyces sp. NPDC101150 TaxID=3366114 RepID=UPI0037F4C118